MTQAINLPRGNTQAGELLQTLFTPLTGQHVTLWAKNDKNSRKTSWYKLDSEQAISHMAAEALQWSADGWDTYYSTCPSKEVDYIGSKTKRIRAIDVAEIPALFMDIDTLLDPKKKEEGAILPADIEEAKSKLLELPIPPSAMVCSGNGIHAYWQLKAPLEATQEHVRLLKSWAYAVKSMTGWESLDAGASEPARVLRLPDTNNYKRGIHSPQKVELIHLSDDRYNPEEFESIMQAQAQEQMLQEIQTDAKQTDDEVIQRCRQQPRSGQEFAQLFERGYTAGADESAEDFELAQKLAHVTQDPQQIERIMSRSAIGQREKWQERADYRQNTIDKAIDRYNARPSTQETRVIGLEAGELFDPLEYWETKEAETEEEDRPSLTYDIFASELRNNGITIKYNLMLNEMEFSGLPSNFSEESLLNTAPAFIRDQYLAPNYKNSDRKTVEEYILRAADWNRYNPVTEWLIRLERDGSSAIDWLCNDVLHLDAKDQLSRAFVRKWLIQCVAMAHNGEGGRFYGADGVLTLQGSQGVGKTSFIRELVPNQRWQKSGNQIDMQRTDTLIKALGTWISELGEVDSTMKKEQSALKSFITDERDEIRIPYGKAATKSPRRTSFAATVNDEDYLRDPTGSRRWWTVPLAEPIDWELLKEADNRAQVWAEAYELWLQDPQGFRLTRSEQAALAKRNGNHNVSMTGEEELLAAFWIGWERQSGEGWNWLAGAEIRESIHERFSTSATASQIGRVLTKISKDYPQIIKDTKKSPARWRVPLDKPTHRGS